MFFFDPLYLLFALPGLLLGLWAQARVKGTFNKYAKVGTSRSLSGAQVARALLDANGLYDVAIEESRGFLSDHYDPRHKVLRLSPDVYNGRTVSAAGVAAHEMGHALQDANRYFPLQLRSALVPAAQFGSNLGIWIIFGGLILSFEPLAWIGLILFGAAVLFSIVTLPVEFDASKRAKSLLLSQNIMFNDEIKGVNKVLDAAALTYVAAAVAAIGTFLYYALAILGGNRD